jgi:hypothetical protein
MALSGIAFELEGYFLTAHYANGGESGAHRRNTRDTQFKHSCIFFSQYQFDLPQATDI